MKWIELSEEEKKEKIEKTYQSISDNEESVNFKERFEIINPDIEITEEELYRYMSG